MNDDRGRKCGLALHARLRVETADLHREVDRNLAFLLEPELSLERYRRALAAFYGFHAPVEAQLFRRQAQLASLAVPLLDRARWLRQDLAVLGFDVDAVSLAAAPAELPRLSSTAQLAGCLYVLEGASLGGQVIARAVRRSLAIDAAHGLRFFCGERTQTAIRWRAVVAWLEALAPSLVVAELVQSARETFRTFDQWMRTCGVGA